MKIDNAIVKKLEDLIQHENIKYDDYFKVVYSSKVIVNNEEFKFRYTEEDGVGVKLEIFDNEIFEEVDFYSKFEWHFIAAILSQGHTSDLSNMKVGMTKEFGYDKDAYDSEQILELC